MDGFLKIAPACCLQILIIVDPCVIDNAVNVSVLLVGLFNDRGYSISISQVKDEDIICITVLFYIFFKPSTGLLVLVNDDRGDSLLGKLQGDTLANTLKATGDDNNLVFHVQIHLNSFVDYGVALVL